jgi:hypothetical protein
MRIEEEVRFGVALILVLFSACLVSTRATSWAASKLGGIQLTRAEFAPGEHPSPDDYARLLAGLSPLSPPLDVYENRPAWIQYSRFLDQTWKKFTEMQLTPMRDWASKELGAASSSNLAVFYPFSGPDFVNPYTFFPHAKAYILMALEPPGEVPNFEGWNGKDFDSFFAKLKNSLNDILHVDYFISAHMRASFGGKELKGVLPILMVFLAREHTRILDVARWTMTPDGAISEAPAFGQARTSTSGISGLKIVFADSRSSGDRPQTLYYFRFNVFDFGRMTEFANFMRSYAPLITFMKSASFVMVDPHASAIRQFALDQSRYILQEDSGIPYKYFDRTLWNLRFYGVYKKPIIPLFKQDYQKDLAEAYKSGKDIKPLPFGIGYHFRLGDSNLMWATRK